MKRVLILENSPILRESLTIILKNEYEVTASPSLLDGLSLLKKERIDLIILGVDDLCESIRDLIEEFVEIKENTPLILLGEQRLLNVYQKFLEGYVSVSIVLPLSIFELREKVKQSLFGFVSPLWERSYENRLIEKYQRLYNSPLLDGKVKRLIPKILGSKTPILLRGERGSGKETIAKIIHYVGSRKAGAFIKLGCTSLTGDSLDSQLKMMTPVRSGENVEVCLYWDEIGKLGKEIQVRLEEILEEGMKVVSPLGLSVFPRIIASSSEDLNEVIGRGEFRESLFYKLNHLPLHIRPLRERIEDLPLIVQEVINTLSEKGFLKRKLISPEALEILKNYYWPGNLRELESVILRSGILSGGETITKEDISLAGGEEITTQGTKEKQVISPPRAEETETTLEKLLDGLAHEIKNPLVAIKTFTQLLSGRFDDAEFRDQFYQVVGKSIDRIEWLTKRVLDYANFLKAQLIPVNFSSLLDHVITENQGKLSEKKISIRREGLESLPPSIILSDPRQLSYVLENIFVHIYNDLPVGSQVAFSTRISHLKEEEKKLFPLKDLIDDRIAELKISLPSLPYLSSPGGMVSHLGSPRCYSLELFLSQLIINRNLGIMEETVGEGEVFFKIKLPMSEYLR